MKHAPDVDTDKPVARQKEAELARHYSWPEWWGMVPAALPGLQAPKHEKTAIEDPSQWPGDTHLRSLSEVTGYAVQARDERIGKLKDLIAQTDSWVIRHFVVDARVSRSGGEVLLSPAWVERIDWNESSLVTGMTASELRESPPFSHADGVNGQRLGGEPRRLVLCAPSSESRPPGGRYPCHGRHGRGTPIPGALNGHIEPA